MPRRSQEAEDEAYALALQDEYRQEFLRRQEEQERRETRARSRSRGDRGDRQRDRDRVSTRSSSRDRKKKSKKTKKKSSKNNRSKSRNRTSHRSRSSSRDSMGSVSGRDKRRRRRHRSGSNEASEMSGDEWLSAYHPDQQPQHRRNQEQPQQHHDPPRSWNDVIPLPPPPYVDDDYNDDNRMAPDWGRNQNTYDDEEYARRIQQEMEDADYAQKLSERERERDRRDSRRPGRSSSNAPPATTPVGFSGQRHSGAAFPSVFSSKDSSSSGGSTEPMTDEDEAVARRIQQELADAEYAERISTLEREEAASRDIVLSLERQNQLNLAQQQQQQAPPRSCVAKWLPMVLCIAVAITIPLLYFFDVFNPSDIPFLGDLFQDDWEGGSVSNITFNDINGTMVPQLPSDAFGWANTGDGLRLDVLNACTDEWQPFVQTALNNWENGSPIDSLTLYTSRIPYEKDCMEHTGKLKICNGNYGDTKWRGLNEVLLKSPRSTIVASTAKLNEYYLNYESDAQKLYTCCHELGHGFGLPHWDEDFFNKDIGNCMDYTQNPHKSSTPDASNFFYLAQLYGGRDVNTNQDLTPEQVSVMAMGGSAQDGNGKDKNVFNRGVRSLYGTSRAQLLRGDARAGIPLSESRIDLDNDVHGPSGKRRILHADESSEIHMFPSETYEGVTVIQHYLLVEDDGDSK